MSDNELVFLPLGGVGEIGMNLALYGFGPAKKREWIMVDCGVTFPDERLPGVDLVLPDIGFVQELGDALKAIIITHAHEDHYGAVLALWPFLRKPVFMTPFAAGMLEAKAVGDNYAEDVPVTLFRPGDKFKAGPFEIEAIHVTHSIPEPVALAISCKAGRVIHTGDWKLDEAPSLGAVTDQKRLKQLGDEGVLALICDSTNAMREGVSPSEQAVSQSLADMIAKAKGRVAVTTFSSNVGRIRSVAMAAESASRRVLLMGRSIRRVCDVVEELGYLDGLQPFVDLDEFSSIERSKLVIICTGSQGEDRAALAKISRDEHPVVSLTPGDQVIFSSRTIPGNEKPILNIKNRLIDMGVDVIEDDDGLVHVSGHPRRNELKQIYEWLKPEILVPVHGEAAHLSAHARFGAQSGIGDIAPIRNGDLLRLFPGPSEVLDSVIHGRVYLDGNMIGDEEEIGVRQRRKLSYSGIVTCSVVIDRHGKLADEIDVVLHGIPAVTLDGEAMEDVVYDAANGAVQSIPPKHRKDVSVVENAVYKSIRGEVRRQWGKKPVVTVFVSKV